MPSLRFRLRLFWYRLDKEACAVALVFGLLIGGLGFVTHSVYASREQALRFRAEAESAARLQHPNIVRIHETGEQDGQPYFSMDYVEGSNLTRLVREKPLTALLIRTSTDCMTPPVGSLTMP